MTFREALLGTCGECEKPTNNLSTLCDECAVDYADPCSCPVHSSDMAHLVPCMREKGL